MACPAQEKRWLDMAILDLQNSKQTEALMLDQVKTLLEEKKLLEQKLKLQHDSWHFDKQRLEETLQQEKREHKKINATQSYQMAALHVSLGSYQQEALMFKLRHESALDEVDILSTRLQILNLQLQEKNVDYCQVHKLYLERENKLRQSFAAEKSFNKSRQQAWSVQRLSDLKRENALQLENLKKEHHDLSLKWKAEASALIREKNFVWDQFKRMEQDYASRLETKIQELSSAEENLRKLELQVDELQKAYDEKTVEATILKINVQAAEAELVKVSEDLSQLDPSEHAMGTTDDSSVVTQESGPTAIVPCIEGQCCINRQEVPADNQNAWKLLSEKEKELKKAKRFVEDLRLENQNLQSLYADLEEKLKGKQVADLCVVF